MGNYNRHSSIVNYIFHIYKQKANQLDNTFCVYSLIEILIKGSRNNNCKNKINNEPKNWYAFKI